MIRRTLSKTLVVVGLAGGAVAAPVGVGSSSTSSLVFQVNEACGQATECVYAKGYLCSTYNADHEDYKCSKGCKEEEQ